MQKITIADGRTVTLDIDTLSPEQGNMLAVAAADLLIRSGRIRDDVAMNGPQLLQFMSELGDELAQQHAALAPDLPGESKQVQAGDLDAGTPNHHDHNRRGFDPR